MRAGCGAAAAWLPESHVTVGCASCQPLILTDSSEWVAQVKAPEWREWGTSREGRKAVGEQGRLPEPLCTRTLNP